MLKTRQDNKYTKVYSIKHSLFSKQIWCFNCNSMRNVCIHDSCPEHCDLCFRIKKIKDANDHELT